MPKYYLTTPIYYVNARPHLGHTYTTIVADTIARFKRMCGYEVAFLTGTDEHGQKVERSARAAGLEPKGFADRISAIYQQLWKSLDLNYTHFVRTTDAAHEVAVKKIFEACRASGSIYKGKYEGQYCVFDELYVSDPAPGAPCPECGRATEHIVEENYFFKLSAFQERLLEHYQKYPEFIQPETRRNEVVSFVEGGLRDLSISRTSLRWGIPTPTADGHVFYVWFDALTSYLSGIGYGDPTREEKEFTELWPADLHLVGKEILRFHAVYWPAFLMAAGLPLPKTIFAHGWLLFEQDKMSKSRGNIVRPEPIQKVLGIDALRYFLLRELVFGQDGSFSYDALVGRYNSDLANDLGNLASRTLAMIHKYFAGKIPYPSAVAEHAPADREIAELAERTITAFRQFFDRFEFSKGLEAVWGLVSAVNKYIVENEPWALAEHEAKRPRLASVLYTSAEAVRVAAALLYPVMPQACEKIWRQLGDTSELAALQLSQLAFGQLPVDSLIDKVEAVFPRVEKSEAIARLRELEEEAQREAAGSGSTPGKEGGLATDNLITIEDFAKVDMRVGEVRSAERVRGTTKLVKLMVDIGDEVRQVIAGIAEAYEPEALVGKKVVIVINLQPRKLRGLDSNGMIVAATVGEEGRPVLVTFTEDVPNGARLK